MSSAGDNNKPSDRNGHGGARRSMPPGERGERPSLSPEGTERRSFPRFDVEWAVDYASGDTFLYSYITNISAMGIFILSKEPLPLGTHVKLRFQPPGGEPFAIEGEVAWVNPFREGGENLNPGMGLRFVNLSSEERERLVDLVKTIAYLPDAS